MRAGGALLTLSFHSFLVHRRALPDGAEEGAGGLDKVDGLEGKGEDRDNLVDEEGRRVIKKSGFTEKGWSSFRQKLTEDERRWIKEVRMISSTCNRRLVANTILPAQCKENQTLYIVPHLLLDDYFWLLPSALDPEVKVRERERVGRKKSSPNSLVVNTVRSSQLLSNDLLRDHKGFADVLGDVDFHRWVTSQFVGFGGLGIDKDVGEAVIASALGEGGPGEIEGGE